MVENTDTDRTVCETIVAGASPAKYMADKVLQPKSNDGGMVAVSGAKQRMLAGLKPPWAKGQSGNPAGPPKAKVQFWRYVQQYSALTLDDIDKIDRKTLSLSKLGALEYALKLSHCEWSQVKEALDRDEGAIVKKQETKLETDQPATLIINMAAPALIDQRDGLPAIDTTSGENPASGENPVTEGGP